MSTYVDIHVIQSVPPSCVNRDDSGSPKSAQYGGVRRLRVSSQSWKRATRLFFNDRLDASDVGMRTKRVVEVLAARITERAPELSESAVALAEEVFKAAKIKLSPPRGRKDAPQESGYLLFLSTSQVDRLAGLAITSSREGQALDAKAVKKVFKETNSVDIALFGRMVADDTDLNVDAACQVAHAISTHAAENEYDFFTAVDDEKDRSEEEDAGAGMMGTVEFSSATMYRYATVNLDMLVENLGSGEAALRALEVFVQGFCLSMPTGKQNTFANHTLPEAIVVSVREDQPVSLVGAFEKPVRANESSGYLTASLEALSAHARTIEDNYGLRPRVGLVVSLQDSDAVSALGERVSFADLSGRVRDAVAPLVIAEEQDS
ncbi:MULTISPECIES: type I-E CRISPR-associated protein Cas7/Cse4/CasC [unclassified Actinomyces]|uniref:type I-E CRISPR-associated protein Cas7/Cse4/CasC n=1 Tax=unclassified Actinomyces TaxID=2609248 RepID=UPI002017EC9F|nr:MULTISPECIES: type I-E CRISPR-associated protein Cas7/Cse4/CasC [unclassified Actinomyces]MCL3778430.1 type I-E CRISPR-associated protein Cas7/Cse4/CasC [Actinomyces sp. AC-20-1]MCL3790009.1 type I-E CRISPR-associated protein Cas7/Cse4/CasC [Actinomyces sp. 187325]MCL3792553.1 type I-E CRISPR-associated protein Cas7/Cse4/CasC [Actinomyces sp. 186855]MCL3794586.1 type I-E CRISPR-associated protein Cas7/Cse4/CasC [Actinomyces sp. 217892]